MAKTRLEKDSMGELAVPAEALYGASTERAVINFPISDLRFQSSFIRALAIIKACAAEVNKSSGDLDGLLADAIKAAALKVASGAYDDQFVVDIWLNKKTVFRRSFCLEKTTCTTQNVD